MDSGYKLTGMTPKIKSVLPYGLALLSGALLALSFPKSEFYLFAWVAFSPLLFAIRKQSSKKSFLLGWISGLCFYSPTLSWLSTTIRDFGGLPSPTAIGINFLLVAYLALYTGLFCALLSLVSEDRRQALLLLAPALWVTLEYTKGHLLTGFPWVSLAYSQYRNLSMIQIADFGSIYSVSFVIVLFNSAFYLFIENRRSKKPVFLVLFVLLLTFSYGKFRLSQRATGSESVSIAVIQGNIGQTEKWDREFQEVTIEKYLRLSETTLQKDQNIRPDLILWPESALPFIFGTETAHEKSLFDFVKKEQIDLLVGAPSMNSPPGKAANISLFNSAFLINPDKGIAARYDKIHLVPFGEYVPFADLFFFVKKIVSGISDFSPGSTTLVMSTGESRIGVAICYEVIFPELVRQFVKNGAGIMTTITNDAWFGQSAAPYQHFSMLVFRAIENRVPFARAANTGISGFIDAQGRVISQSKLDVEASLTESLIPGKKKTFYTLYGDLFVVLCAMIAAIFLLGIIIKRRKPHVF